MSSKSVSVVAVSRAGQGLGLPRVAKDMAEQIDMDITTEADVVVVAFKSASMIDVDAIASAAAKIKEFVEANRPGTLVFDFEAVKFFSSQVLGLLLDVRAKAAAYDGEVVVSAINPQLHRVFKITNLDKVFRFFPDRRRAIGSANAE
jgi:anti-sigma B factor antagonist